MSVDQCWCCLGRILEDGSCPFCDGGGWLSDPPHSCRRSGRIFTNEWGHDPVDDPCDTCDYDPTELLHKPIGMFHCPQCLCMVLAGEPHGPHEPRNLKDPRSPIGDWKIDGGVL